MISAPRSLPGTPVSASISRTPRAGGPFVSVMSLTLRRFMGVLFQPEDLNFTFNQQQGAAVYKRYFCFADWPRSIADPMPVHSGDALTIPFPTPVGATVQAAPTPTAASFSVEQGRGAAFTMFQPITVGGQNAFLGAVSNDVLYVDPSLPAVPAAGAAVVQTGLRYIVDTADAWEGSHIKIYVRLVPHNA